MVEIVWKRGAEDDLLRIFAEQWDFVKGAASAGVVEALQHFGFWHGNGKTQV